MKRSTLVRLSAVAVGATVPGATTFGAASAAAKKSHRLSVHVDQNDPAVMNQSLNNIENVISHYDGTGETVEIELVAYGPGLHMLRDDTSPVKPRLVTIKSGMSNVTFSACNVTRMAMQKAEGHEIPLVAQARVVPGGVVRLLELQEAGWPYIKP